MLSPKKFWHHAHQYLFADFLSLPMIFLLEWLFDGFVPRGNHNSKVLITDTSREIRKNGEMAVAALHLPTSCTSRQHLIVKDSNLSSSTKGPSAKKNRTQSPSPSCGGWFFEWTHYLYRIFLKESIKKHWEKREKSDTFCEARVFASASCPLCPDDLECRPRLHTCMRTSAR